jgi:uncharacterized protein (UPF0332 family)
MTDKKTLYQYRIKQAEETISDAEKMLKNHLSHRSTINRAYYSMFYAMLALYINEDLNLKTSKHSGVISIFDKEFVHTGKIDKKFSKILHRIFIMRQEGDYKELVEISRDDAARSVADAKEFLSSIKKFIKGDK